MSQLGSSLNAVGLASEGSVPDVNTTTRSLVDALEAHARVDFPNAHGKWASCNVNIYDQSSQVFDGGGSIGLKIANQALQVKVNGATWLLPCVSVLGGTPGGTVGAIQVPVIVEQPQSQSSDGYGKGPPAKEFVCGAVGTSHMSFTWEIKIVGAGDWFVAELGITYACDKHKTVMLAGLGVYTDRDEIFLSDDSSTISSTLVTGLAAGQYSTIYSRVMVNCDSIDDEGSASPAIYIRCRVDNSAAGGGYRTSDEASLEIKDTTGC